MFSSCPIPNAQGPIGAVGPVDAPILFVGEAGGRTEGRTKVPFSGEAGYELDRLLGLAKISREDCRIGNTVACSPPGDWLVGAPWEGKALAHCEAQLEALLAERHKVVVPLGGTALRAILKLPRAKGKEPAKVQDFHGAPIWDNRGFWICPTYHPSFNSRSARKYTLCMNFDLTTAREIAEGRWEPDEPDLVIVPPVAWFERWASEYLASAQESLLDADIETPDKRRKSDESELGKEDKSYQILHINFACSGRQGITVPWVEPYVTIAKRVLEEGGPVAFHNANYDVRRLRAAGIRIAQERIHDSMDAWHVLYSSLPRGLGFVAPFFSRRGPWKHLGSESGEYRALDAVQGWRVMTGCLEELRREGLLPVYERHMHDYDVYVLKPAEEEGLGMSREALVEFSAHMKEVCTGLDAEIQAQVPEAVKSLDLLMEGPYVREITGEGVVRRDELSLVQTCSTCGAVSVSKKHRCADRELTPHVELVERVVPRWYRRVPFNPASWQQVLAVIKAKGHKPGKNRKTKGDTTDKKTLMRLVKTGDPFYSNVLEFRRAGKMGGTYGEGMLERLDVLDRVHGTASHIPSTLRLSWVDPNLQNVASHVKYASEFRRAVIAAPGSRLMSFDYSGIEAVMVGYFSGDPAYIRLAKLGVHAFVESNLLFHIKKAIPEVASLSWSDADLRAHFKEIKARFEAEYEQSKRTVHGYNYGLTEYGLSETFPELFPKRGLAKQLIDLYTAVCPKLSPWQATERELAHRQKYLGGPGAHPFGYKHWFFSVLGYRKVGGVWREYLGDDAKKAVAFFPQSAAAGTICEAALELMTPGAVNYVGDCGPGGRTPLRAIIHDDLTFEVRDEMAEWVKAAVVQEMTRGIEEMPMPEEWGLGRALTVGVAVKEGKNWAPYHEEKNPEGMRVLGAEELAGDVWQEEEEEDEDEVA